MRTILLSSVIALFMIGLASCHQHQCPTYSKKVETISKIEADQNI